MSNAPYMERFEELEAVLADGAPQWLARLRRRSMARFTELGGIPTTRHEEWKYTNVKPLQSMVLSPAVGASGGFTADALARLGLPDPDATRLVFVDGHISEALSRIQSLPEGTVVTSLARVLRDEPEAARPYLDSPPDDEAYPFAAVNTAFAQDGAFIRVPKSAVVAEPIELVFVATAADEPTVSHPRNVIVLGENSQATIVETYASVARGPYMTNAVTQIHLGQNAVADHYKLQHESLEAFHIAKIRVVLERSSNYTSHNVSIGGGLVRNDIQAVLDGEGIECLLNGLYLAKGRQHVDNHTAVDHQKPHCHSHELYKGVLDGRATGVFNGKIFVRQAAQKTDAIQSNKNLLLSDNALINTKPQLEIWADDVRCTHGATVGQLEPEALFYLRSRGLAHDDARSLLTYAFANEVIKRARVETIRERVEHELGLWLLRAPELTEAAR